MKGNRFLQSLFLILILGMFSVPLAALASAVATEKPTCPTVVQSGEVEIRIPAGEETGAMELQFIRCSGMNIQVTGGTMLQTPVVVNAVAHHDYLILQAFLQESQPGPVDVTVWWRVD
jgi:hypothetical protein